jgi:hypothetical protein
MNSPGGGAEVFRNATCNRADPGDVPGADRRNQSARHDIVLAARPAQARRGPGACPGRDVVAGSAIRYRPVARLPERPVAADQAAPDGLIQARARP